MSITDRPGLPPDEAIRKKNLVTEYQWAIKRLQEVFGQENVGWHLFDWDTCIAFHITNGKTGEDLRRHGIRVEFFYDSQDTTWSEPSQPDDPDEESYRVRLTGTVLLSSLNARPDKEIYFETVIEDIKRKLEV